MGTSSGSITGTLLRANVPRSELAAWTVRAPLTTEGRVLHQMLGTEIPDFEPFRLMHLLRLAPNLPGWELLRNVAIRPWNLRPMVAALALLAPGRFDIATRLAMLREVEGQSWPARDLWICAVRRSDGRRVVFGRPGSPDVPLHLAIAASCAVPGYFAPVTIDDHTYVDGGARSPRTPRSCVGAPSISSSWSRRCRPGPSAHGSVRCVPVARRPRRPARGQGPA